MTPASAPPHVYVQVDSSWHALKPLYRGPYVVRARHSKTLEVDVGGQPQWISIDRLKPAYLLSNSSNCVMTRSGWVSRPPLFFQGGMTVVTTFYAFSVSSPDPHYALVGPARPGSLIDFSVM